MHWSDCHRIVTAFYWFKFDETLYALQWDQPQYISFNQKRNAHQIVRETTTTISRIVHDDSRKSVKSCSYIASHENKCQIQTLPLCKSRPNPFFCPQSEAEIQKLRKKQRREGKNLMCMCAVWPHNDLTHGTKNISNASNTKIHEIHLFSAVIHPTHFYI